jgi:DNA-binding protein
VLPSVTEGSGKAGAVIPCTTAVYQRYYFICYVSIQGGTIYKTDIVRTVAKETRLSQRIVADVLTKTLDTITESLRDGLTVVLPGFGTSYTKER